MSRALSHRLRKLEARRSPAAAQGVVMIPWREWPLDDDTLGWEAIYRAHPGPRLFIPSQMTPDEWEAVVPTMQAQR